MKRRDFLKVMAAGGAAAMLPTASFAMLKPYELPKTLSIAGAELKAGDVITVEGVMGLDGVVSRFVVTDAQGCDVKVIAAG